MRKQRILGMSLIAAGLGLFAILAYEPATLANLPGLVTRMSEATVVVLGLIAVAGSCGAGTAMVLRRG